MDIHQFLYVNDFKYTKTTFPNDTENCHNHNTEPIGRAIILLLKKLQYNVLFFQSQQNL